MHHRGDTIPTIEVDPEEDGFGEKREALERERHSDDSARVFHESRPEETELEREHGAGDGAHGEEDGGAPRPAPREVQIDRLTAPKMQAFGDGHEQRHADADRREDDVERERHGHLGAGEDEVGHWPRSLKMIVRPNTKNSAAAARRIQTIGSLVAR